MAREYRLLQVDVFTDRIFGGNPLAVVLDPEGITDDEMQAIAREMNLSETTFVLPPAHPGCAARVRIFTPAREIPFAGHPTIGTAWVLATERRVPPGATTFALEEGVGPIPVDLEGDPAHPTFLWMRHPEATFGPELPDRRGVAAALGLGESDLLPGAPVQTGSTGSPFLLVPLRDRAAVDRAALDVRADIEGAGPAAALGVFVFAPDPDPAAGRVYSRMFAPRSGVPEDPATGSASGPLGAYLLRHGLVKPGAGVRRAQGCDPAGRTTAAGAAREVRPPGEAGRAEPPELMRIVSEQGTKMGRQSFVHIRLAVSNGRASDIRVGGSVVPVLEARLTLP
jgi:trans-2,3-dihydro-3-hydroxyanthranilate isomerase